MNCQLLLMGSSCEADRKWQLWKKCCYWCHSGSVASFQRMISIQQPPSSSSTPNWEKHFFIAGLVHKGLPQTVATIGCTLRLLSKMELCFVELRKTAPDQRYVKVCLFVLWWQCCSVGWSLHLFGSDWIISLLLDELPWNLVHTFMVLRGRRLLSLMIPWLVFLVDSHDIWFKYSSPPQDE